MPLKRDQIDADVSAFYGINTDEVLVLGTDGKLWLARAPFGTVPLSRVQIDADVSAFHGYDSSSISVLSADDRLWIEFPPFGTVPPLRVQIDADVAAFRASQGDSLVLGTDGNLWLEQPPFGSVPPARQQIDGNIRSFVPLLGSSFLLVLGTDGNLWMEQPPYGTPPGRRTLIDGSVAAPPETLTAIGWTHHLRFPAVDVDGVVVGDIDGRVTLTLFPNGDYHLYGTLNNSALVPINVACVVAINDHAGHAVFSFAVSGKADAAYPWDNNNYSFDTSGNNESIAGDWSALSTGWSLNYDAKSSLDLTGIWNGLLQVVGVVKAVV